MTITRRNGDLLKQHDIKMIVHQCNCFHTMGGGFAKLIANRYPLAVEADKQTVKDVSKLGTYSIALTDSKYIVNMYSQGSFGTGECFTNYDAIRLGFTHLSHVIHKLIKTTNNTYDTLKVGVPKRYGSDLGGGDWETVESIFIDIFEDSKIEFIIVDIKNGY
jgi:O-acetyl-ADP-ribose deacetylase (regulator of RNase III)